jgi:hypothetical protein
LNDLVSVKLVYAAVADLQRRVGELERTRATVVMSVTELRAVLEEAIKLCGNVLELSRTTLEERAHHDHE